MTHEQLRERTKKAGLHVNHCCLSWKVVGEPLVRLDVLGTPEQFASLLSSADTPNITVLLGEKYALEKDCETLNNTVAILVDGSKRVMDEVTRLQVRVAELEQRNTNLSKIIDGLPTFCHHCGASLGED